MFLVDDRKNQDRSSSRGVQVGDGGMAKVVEKINREVVKAMDLPQVKRQIAQDAIETRPMTAAEVTQFAAGEIARWTPLIKKMLNEKPQ